MSLNSLLGLAIQDITDGDTAVHSGRTFFRVSILPTLLVLAQPSRMTTMLASVLRKNPLDFFNFASSQNGIFRALSTNDQSKIGSGRITRTA